MRHEDTTVAGHVSKNVSKELVEQLEKSGLSEEHGPPVQAVHGSPESSQDSSKRRKVALPSSGQNKNGNILRIKIRRDQDSPVAVLENSKIPDQPPVLQRVSGSSLLSKENRIRAQNNKGMVKLTEDLQQSIKSNHQGVQRNVQPPVKVLPRVDLPTTAKSMQKVDPRLSARATLGRIPPSPAKMVARVDPSPAKSTPRVDPPPVKAAQRVDLPPTKVLQRDDPQGPSQVILRDAPPCANVLKESGATPFCLPDVQRPPLAQNSEVSVITRPSLPKEEPSVSGRNFETAAAPEVKQSKSDRKRRRKSDKKEKKFNDLFVTWLPSSFEMHDTDVGDQDWFLGCTRKPDASTSDCRASDGSVPFLSMEQQFSLQTRATYLPDLEVYQLPYVVPF